MSHYRVAVFANSPNEFDKLLAPYSENDEAYYEFTPLSGEEVDKLYENYNKHSDLFDSFSEYIDDNGYEYDGDVLGYRSNPNAKWDWYSLDGGDWQFEMKNGETYDDDGNARKNQFIYKNKQYSKTDSVNKWKENKRLSETSEGNDEDQNTCIRWAKLFIQNHPDLDEYLRGCKMEYPYAFITPDGEWHSPGTVGWFGMSDDTPDSMKKYLDEWEEWINSDENPYVNFVDCHI